MCKQIVYGGIFGLILIMVMGCLSGISPGVVKAADPVKVTVAANPQIKVTGEADPVLTYIADDPEVVFSGTLTREQGEAPGRYKINQGTLRAEGNYVIEFIPAELTIIAKVEAAGTAGLEKSGDAPSGSTAGRDAIEPTGNNAPPFTYTLIYIVLLGTVVVAAMYFVLRHIYLSRG